MPDLQKQPNHEAQHFEQLNSDQDKLTGRTRLHITPLDPFLLQAYISTSLLPQATNISYHGIETFPEKRYGYIELPTMEAEKLKKKLNGSILKGTKVKIEDAKLESRKTKIEREAASNVDETLKNKQRSSKKRKREEGMLPGEELPEGRKVERGWTEPDRKSTDKGAKRKKKEKDGERKKKKQKSEYTHEPELLFKTQLPPTKKSEEKLEDGKKKQKKKSKKSETVVHEFSKTKKHKHSIANDANGKSGSVSHYEEGTGWLNANGDVVEPESESRKRRKKQDPGSKADLSINTHSSSAKDIRAEQTRPNSSGSAASHYLQSPGTQLRGELDQALAGAQSMEPEDEIAQAVDTEDSKNPSEESSEIENEIEGVDELANSEEAGKNEDDNLQAGDERASSAHKSPLVDSNGSTSIEALQGEAYSTTERTLLQAPATITTEHIPELAKEVHPLEALYKRPKSNPGSPKKPTPIQTSFTFFDADEGEENDTLGALPMMPQTPFTSQDLEFRGIRSAAPTPDTAAIGKRFFFPWSDNKEEEEEEKKEVEGAKDEDGDVEIEGQARSNVEAMDDRAGDAKPVADSAKEPKEESEFEKWFWEHRGETNRAWKKRRREAMKEKRHRENRRLNRRIV